MNKHKKLAFTLIELLAVIIIIGILSGIGISTYQQQIERARLAKAQFAAGQVERQFLAENASTEENLFTGWFKFDEINQTSPFIIDSSEAKNHMLAKSGSGTFSKSSDTGSGIGSSLRLNTTMFRKDGTVPGGPSDKLTMGSWIKLENYTFSHTYPVFLTSSAGFLIRPDGRIRFYMNSGADYVEAEAGTINLEKWYHIVGSFDGNQMRFWIDGTLVGRKPNVTRTVPFQGRGIYFGYYPNSSFYNGWIDETIIAPFAFDGEELK